MNNGRILCLSTGMSPGGAERQLTGLAVMLKEDGYDVEVAWYYKSDFYQPYLEKNGISCKHLYTSRYILQILKIQQEIKRFKPSVVIAYLEGPTFITSLLKFLGGRFRLIVSERNTTQVLTLRRRLRYFLYRKADYVVPNSHTQSRFLSENFPRLKEKIVTITNFTDTVFFSPTADKNARRIKRILVVGRINNQKNVQIFIKAIAKIDRRQYSFHVDWFGNPLNGSYYDECRNLMQSLSCEDIISFHPATNDILKEYQNSDFFCLPSKYEGFPNVVCEAMSCGLPVLCGNVCDNPIIVKDGVNGFLFDPNDEEDMCTTICKMLNLPDSVVEKMGKEGREMAVNEFSKEKFYKQYLSLIN